MSKQHVRKLKTKMKIIHPWTEGHNFISELFGFGRSLNWYNSKPIELIINLMERDYDRLADSLIQKYGKPDQPSEIEINHALSILHSALPDKEVLMSIVERQIARQFNNTSQKVLGLTSTLRLDDLLQVLDEISGLELDDGKFLLPFGDIEADALIHNILMLVLIAHYVQFNLKLLNIKNVGVSNSQQDIINRSGIFSNGELLPIINAWGRLLTALVGTQAATQLKLNDFYELFVNIERSTFTCDEQMSLKENILRFFVESLSSSAVSKMVKICYSVGFIPEKISSSKDNDHMDHFTAIMKKMKPQKCTESIRTMLIKNLLTAEFLPFEKRQDLLLTKLHLDKMPSWCSELGIDFSKWEQKKLNSFLTWVDHRVMLEFKEIGIINTDLNSGPYLSSLYRERDVPQIIEYLKALRKNSLLKFDDEFLKDLFAPDNDFLTANFTGAQNNMTILVAPFTDNEDIFSCETRNTKFKISDAKKRFYRKGKYDSNADANKNPKKDHDPEYQKILQIQRITFGKDYDK